MKLTHKPLLISALVLSVIALSACNSPLSSKKNVQFSNDDQTVDAITPYVDKFASAPINITKTLTLNQEFTVTYKTVDPSGVGTATFKARSAKEVSAAGALTPNDGKKLFLVEISVRGNSKNKGNPSTFNQIGDNPSPQFVLIDKNNQKTFVETTDFSEGYTTSKNLFGLSKITLDSAQWVDTAIVFQIDKNVTPHLAFRFVNPEAKTEFYDLSL